MGGAGRGARAGEACISEAFVLGPDVTPYSSDVTYRGPNVVNGYKLFINESFENLLQLLTSTVKQQSLFCVPAARFPKQLVIF